MTDTDRSKQYADSVALDDEEAVVRVLYESVLGLLIRPHRSGPP